MKRRAYWIKKNILNFYESQELVIAFLKDNCKMYIMPYKEHYVVNVSKY